MEHTTRTRNGRLKMFLVKHRGKIAGLPTCHFVHFLTKKQKKPNPPQPLSPPPTHVRTSRVANLCSPTVHRVLFYRLDSRHRPCINISALSSLLFSSSSVVLFPLAPLSALFAFSSSLSSLVLSLSLALSRLRGLFFSLPNCSPLFV